MSDFECRNGHMVLPSKGVCDICGERAYYMDGKSVRELEWEKKMDRLSLYDDRFEPYEEDDEDKE